MVDRAFQEVEAEYRTSAGARRDQRKTLITTIIIIAIGTYRSWRWRWGNEIYKTAKQFQRNESRHSMYLAVEVVAVREEYSMGQHYCRWNSWIHLWAHREERTISKRRNHSKILAKSKKITLSLVVQVLYWAMSFSPISPSILFSNTKISIDLPRSCWLRLNVFNVCVMSSRSFYGKRNHRYQLHVSQCKTITLTFSICSSAHVNAFCSSARTTIRSSSTIWESSEVLYRFSSGFHFLVLAFVHWSNRERTMLTGGMDRWRSYNG